MQYLVTKTNRSFKTQTGRKEKKYRWNSTHCKSHLSVSSWKKNLSSESWTKQRTRERIQGTGKDTLTLALSHNLNFKFHLILNHTSFRSFYPSILPSHTPLSAQTKFLFLFFFSVFSVLFSAALFCTTSRNQFRLPRERHSHTQTILLPS